MPYYYFLQYTTLPTVY